MQISRVATVIVSGLLLSVIGTALQENTLTSQEKAGGWELLFDGTNLQGWHSYLEKGTGKDWSVEDGAIVLNKKNSDPSKDYADLVTDREFSNFDLKLQWKAKPCIDSGVMFYVNESPKYKNDYETGLEMQIADLACTVPDSREILRRSGDLYGVISTTVNTVKDAGEWNQFEIIANHGKLRMIQNGREITAQLWDQAWKKMVAESKFSKMTGYGTFHEGHITLQGTEDKGAPGVKIYFRNIMIKKL